MNFYRFKDFSTLLITAICMFLCGTWVGSVHPEFMYIDLLAFVFPLAGWYFWSHRYHRISHWMEAHHEQSGDVPEEPV